MLSFSLQIFVKNENMPMLRYLQSENWEFHTTLYSKKTLVYSMAYEKISVEGFGGFFLFSFLILFCFFAMKILKTMLDPQDCCKEVP